MLFYAVSVPKIEAGSFAVDQASLCERLACFIAVQFNGCDFKNAPRLSLACGELVDQRQVYEDITFLPVRALDFLMPA